MLDVTGNIDEACILTEGFTISGLNAEAYEFSITDCTNIVVNVVEVCEDDSACNTGDDGACTYPEDGFNCDGDCEVGFDCNDVCGGDAVEDDCGVCNGPGSIYECGCADIPEGDCDCDGNVVVDSGR